MLKNWLIFVCKMNVPSESVYLKHKIPISRNSFKFILTMPLHTTTPGPDRVDRL